MLSAAVPRALGGAGANPVELATQCVALGQHCASSAMILAMHHIQVASIAQHCGGSPELEAYLRRVVDEQRLIASVTSEVGPSGDMRQSVACVTQVDGGFTLSKRATTISYGAYAEDLLITARRDPEAAPSNQVLVLVLGGDFSLEEPGTWDTLGMRGTCSAGARASAS